MGRGGVELVATDWQEGGQQQMQQQEQHCCRAATVVGRSGNMDDGRDVTGCAATALDDVGTTTVSTPAGLETACLMTLKWCVVQQK